MRNRKLGWGLVLIVNLSVFATAANAQLQAPPLKVMPLKGGAYWTSGGAGANTGFIVGSGGVIVIDAKGQSLADFGEGDACRKSPKSRRNL